MKENYLGVNVSPLTYEEIIKEIQSRIEQKKQSTIIAVNPEKVMAAQKNEELKQLINNSTFQIADGVGILLASKLKKGRIRSRVTGVDMMARLLKFAADEKKPIYLYGAKQEVVELATNNMLRDYPGLQIAGTTNGYEKDEEALVQRINESGAELLFVALGSPK
ncbi:MAG TPA: WecB/TagA/CpsF family glycosyltransferase, partial [Sporosarcina sp.]|nr:WecB/TagA/CpsF family glycosyltransferase [Sporosarcina sp.]